MTQIIKTTLSTKILGKAEKETYVNKQGEIRTVFKVNGEVVNLATDWQDTEGTMKEIFDAITEDGMAIVPALLKNNYRTSENFIESQIAMVDIDEGLTIEEATADALYRDYGTGYYTTNNHRPEHHKFRIVFEMAEPITDGERMKLLYSALISHFGGDAACKDASRLFYGNATPIRKEWRGGVLSSVKIDELITAHQEKVDAEAKAIIERNSKYEEHEQSDAEKAEIVMMIRQRFSGNYTTITAIGWAMKQCGYTLADFNQAITLLDVTEKARIWSARNNSGKVNTMGTIMHYLYQWYGKDEVIHRLSAVRKAEYIAKRKQAEIDKLKAQRARLTSNAA